jgi:hypothetical protein
MHNILPGFLPVLFALAFGISKGTGVLAATTESLPIACWKFDEAGGTTATDSSGGKLLYSNADASARMAVDGATVHVCFGAKLTPNSFGGRSSYLRSIDNGQTWSEPVFIGEDSAESKVQARQQIGAADGHVFAIWQREPIIFGGILPPDRLGYNRSDDGALTWTGPKLLPGDTGVNREHQQIWMIPGGTVHVAWTHGAPDDPASPTGYSYSLDYGANWSRSEIAISTGAAANLPHGIVADTNWVHNVPLL